MLDSLMRKLIVVGACAITLLGGSSAQAGFLDAFGPNSDFPDSDMVMPFAAKGTRQTFFMISNVGASGQDDSPVPVTWAFYDENGGLIIEVVRYILGEGGTDVVDITAVRDKAADGTQGPPTSLAGRDGFVVVDKDDGQPDLVGTYTIANLDSNSAFGGNGAGLGYVGILEPNLFLFGNTFAPVDLQDNLLMILAIDDLELPPTSVTIGVPANPGETIFTVQISLHSNQGDGLVATVDQPVEGSALFVSLEELFPGFVLDSSMTITVLPLTEGVATIGFYGQAVGPFGAGQSFRTELPAE